VAHYIDCDLMHIFFVNGVIHDLINLTLKSSECTLTPTIAQYLLQQVEYTSDFGRIVLSLESINKGNIFSLYLLCI
jgi:hypothetical protein